MSSTLDIPKRPTRNFLPEDFKLTTWEALKSFFDDLLAREINAPAQLKKWLQDRSELESALSEDMGWRYIRMTCFTENEEYRNAYQDFVQNIQPEIAPVSDQLNRKAMASPSLSELEKEQGYDLMVRNLKKDIQLLSI